MKKRWFLILAILVSASVWAHQDRIIELRENQLVGLPEKYQPAILDIVDKKLSIAGKELVIPNCYGQFFPKTNEFSIFITASWYHSDISELPPYMGVRVSEQGKTYSHFIQLEPLDFFCRKEEKRFCTSILGYKSIEDSCYKEVEVRDSSPDA